MYTVLTGDYETLNEQPAAANSRLPFICFTDNPALTSQSWQLRPFKNIFPADPVRSQRHGKMHPHLYLPAFRQSLYIDNTVRLKIPPEDIFKTVSLKSGMALPLHSFRTTLADEFAIAAEQLLDDPARIAEQLAHYQASYPQILAQPPIWGGLILRDHRHIAMQRAMSLWFAQLCRYARRDQLSCLVACHLAGLNPHFLALDNHQSALHDWPILTNRKTKLRHWPNA